MKLKLIERKIELPGVESFIFEPLEKIFWKAGQFAHYVLHHEPTDNRGSDRWFTIAEAPFEGKIRITTRFTDETGSTFKLKLKSLVVGKNVEISNISGDFIVEDLNQEYVFIAGGIGITPFRAILKELEHEGKSIKVTLLYSNRDQNIVYKEELENLAKNNPSFKIHYIFSPEHIDEAKIKDLISDLKKPLFYVSGPEPMVDAIGELLKKMGVAEDHLKQDWFPNYPAE